MFGALYASDNSATEALLAIARDFTPRFEICGPRASDVAQASDVVLDLSGLARLFGDPRTIAAELRRAAVERGVHVRVAIAGTRTAARLLAMGVGRVLSDPAARRVPKAPPYTDVIVVDAGSEAAAVAPLPLALLAHVANENDPDDPNGLLRTFHRWGLRTLGDLAALPADALAARLGTDGVRWHRLAQGHDLRPLRPTVAAERFEQSLDLEWPIEGLEPLSFVLGRLIEPLAAHLDRRGRGATVLHLRLHLVTRAVHERSLQLPAPMRDARTLRTLLLLDLESHPPSAAIDRVVVAADPTPARVLQFSLLTRPLPSPEQLSTLAARLAALMGEGRCGSPAAVDSWQPGAFAMKPFVPPDANAIHPYRPQRHRDTELNVSSLPVRHADEKAKREPDGLCGSESLWPVEVNTAANCPAVALRRFRVPVPVRVRVEHDTPVRVITDRRAMSGGPTARILRGGVLMGGRVTTCAGPWRTSGSWWNDGPRAAGASPSGTEKDQKDLCASVSLWPVEAWDRDEWDVTLGDGGTYRIFRVRATDAWFLEGVYD